MIYEYHCLKCQKSFDLVRPVAKRNRPAPCPLCHQKTTKRVLGVANANTGKGSRFPGICHSIDHDPVFIRSKTHFREECNKRDLVPVG